MDRALLVRVKELDRILDREDMDRPLLVHAIDDGRQGRRLARPGRAGHEHDAVAQLDYVFELRRQSEIIERRDADWNDAHDDGVRRALPEDVHAESTDA